MGGRNVIVGAGWGLNEGGELVWLTVCVHWGRNQGRGCVASPCYT